MTNRTLTLILLLLMALALAWLFHIHGVRLQKQQEQYEELKSDYHHLNRRLLAREFPEMVRAHKRWKKKEIL